MVEGFAMNTGPFDAFVQHGSYGDDYIVRGANNAIVVEGLDSLGEAKMWARRLNDAYQAGYDRCLDKIMYDDAERMGR
jgi:hypothetical protein